ncbi:MAG TPA: CmcJ/NvfI family oxidoreductase [Sphingobium sp.]
MTAPAPASPVATSSTPAATSVQASLNFLRPAAERPVHYQYEPPPGVPVRTGDYDPHLVTIHNARTLPAELSLDREGFALLQAPSDFGDFGDEEAIRRYYYQEVERLLRHATGAALVLTFDHNIRNGARAASGNPGIKAPVERTHNDFTARSAPDRARRELTAHGLDADAWLAHRFAIINLWRPIGRTVEKSPLALCDAQSVRADDLVATDLVYRDRVGEIQSLVFHPDQRWYYFPHLAPDEAILIKGHDSAGRPVGDGIARLSCHSAFHDPTSPAGAPERESIEARALVFYPD